MNMVFNLAAILVLLVMSAFFSGSEIAYSALSRARLESIQPQSNAVRRAGYIAEHFDRALSTILIGNNLVNLSASSITTLIALTIASKLDAVTSEGLISSIASIVLTVLVLIFGESMPKIFAKRNAVGFAIKVASPLRVLMILLTPITWIVGLLEHLLTHRLKGEKLDEDEEAEAAEEELVNLIESSEDDGIIDEDRSELLQNALDFAEISAQEVMTARVDMVAIDIHDDWESIEKIIDESSYSRIPVYEDRLDNILGVLHLKHYYRALLDETRPNLRDLLIQPCYVYKTMKLPTVMNLLKKQQTHIAIVTDDYGGTIGIVTMEDVLEQIVGDIWDEMDEVVDEVVERNEHEFEIDGDVTIGEFCELMEWNEDEFETDSVTVGGWTLEMFEAFPNEGDKFQFRNITVTVLKMDNIRVERILVTIEPDTE